MIRVEGMRHDDVAVHELDHEFTGEVLRLELQSYEQADAAHIANRAATYFLDDGADVPEEVLTQDARFADDVFALDCRECRLNSSHGQRIAREGRRV